MLAIVERPTSADQSISPVEAASRSLAAAEATPARGWYEMLGEFQRLSQVLQTESVMSRAAARYADKLAPKPADIRHYGGVRGIENDYTLMPEVKAERVAAFEAWERPYQEALARFGYEERPPEELDADCDARADLETALLMTPAPDQRALCEQLRLHLEHHASPLIGESIDDPRYFSTLLVSDEWEVRTLAATYQGALRLNHLRPEIAYVAPFDADALIHRAEVEGVRLLVGDPGDARYPFVTVSIPMERLSSASLSGGLSYELEMLTTAEVRVLRRALKVYNETQAEREAEMV